MQSSAGLDLKQVALKPGVEFLCERAQSEFQSDSSQEAFRALEQS